METASIEETVNGQAGFEDDAECWTFGRRRCDNGTSMENNETSSERKEGRTWPSLEEKETNPYPDRSGRVDPTFNLERAPAIALLCQVCHTALLTAVSLSKNEAHKQKLASGALRVRIWGMDLFDPTQCKPLDELLSLPALGRISLRRHLTGVWADIAATLELILLHLINQTDEASQENCTLWRRLRIVLGHEDVATAVHDGFGPPGSLDSDSDYTDSNEILDGSINSLEGLIDCLFDLLVTIGTIRQLDKLGFKPAATSSLTFYDIEKKANERNKEVEASSARPSRAPSWANDTKADTAGDDWGGFSTKSKKDKKKSKKKAKTEAERIPEPATAGKFVDMDLIDTPKLDFSFGDAGAGKDTATNSSSGGWDSWTQKQSVETAASQNLQKPQTLSAGISANNIAENVSRGTQFSASDAVPREAPNGRVNFSRAATHDGLQDQETGSGETRDLTEDADMYNNARQSHEVESLPPKPALASSHINLWSRKPIKFIDDHGRIFVFPFELCRTWKGMQGFIKEAFMGMTGSYRARIRYEKYDLVSHDDNEVIVPSLWETVISPGMTIRMKLYSVVPSDVQAPYQAGLYHTNYKSHRSEKQPESFQKDSIVPDEHRSRNRSHASRDGGKETSQDGDTTPTISVAAKRDRKAPLRPSPPPVISRGNYRPTRMLPQFPSLPYFEDIGIEKQPQYFEPPEKSGKDYDAPVYPDSTYSSAHPSARTYSTAGQPNSYSAANYASHSGVPSTMATMPESQRYAPPISSALPSDSDRDQMMRDLFNQGIQQVREAAIKETEAKCRTQAGFERFLEREEASQAMAYTADAKQGLDAKAAKEKRSMEVEVGIKEHAADAQATVSAESIQFEDVLGRRFTYPIQLCSTWEDMEALIVGSLAHIDIIGKHVLEGHYDLVNSSNHILLPSVWEQSVEPGWKIKMHMWPIPETDWSQVQSSKALQSPPSTASTSDEEDLFRSGKSRWKERVLRPFRTGKFSKLPRSSELEYGKKPKVFYM